MSRENVDLVRRQYAVLVDGFDHGHFERGDFDAFFEWLDPEIEWLGPPEFPDLAEPRYGHKGVREYVTILLEAIEDYRMVPEESIDAGDDRVLVFSREGGHGRGSGAEVLTADRARMDDSQRQGDRLRSYWERADALEAVELRE